MLDREQIENWREPLILTQGEAARLGLRDGDLYGDRRIVVSQPIPKEFPPCD